MFNSNDLWIGWFQGREDNFAVDGLVDVVKGIVSNLNIENENILFFSTSSGGIPAINLAKNFLGCDVFAGNIQTNALLFYSGSVDKMLKASYPGKSKEQVSIDYKHRISIDHIDSDFNLYYAQNLADNYHFKTFFQPFSESRRHIRGYYYTYDHEKSGHGPMQKNVELAVIKNILQGNSLDSIYRNIT